MSDQDAEQLFEVTITARVSLHGYDVESHELQRTMQHVLEDYTDGRYRFSVEMIHDGMQRLFATTISAIINDKMWEKYRHHPMVAVGDKSQSSKAAIEAEQAIVKVKHHVSGYLTPTIRPLSPDLQSMIYECNEELKRIGVDHNKGISGIMVEQTEDDQIMLSDSFIGDDWKFTWVGDANDVLQRLRKLPDHSGFEAFRKAFPEDTSEQ